MADTQPKILIYAFGNPGRQDDGLGCAMIEKLEAWAAEKSLTGIIFDNNYQLNIEDAQEISDKELVIFIDASTEDIEDFVLTPVNEDSHVAFTSHAASPGYIVQLCRQLYKKSPPAYLLHIKGYEWDFNEEMTERAKENLEKAFEAIKEKLITPEELIRNFNNYS